MEKNCCKNHHAYSMIGVKKGGKYWKKKKKSEQNKQAYDDRDANEKSAKNN